LGDIKPVDQKHPSVTFNVHGRVLKDITNEPARMGVFRLTKRRQKVKNENTLQATIAMLPDSQPETVVCRTTTDSPHFNKSSKLVAASNKPAAEANNLLDNYLLPQEMDATTNEPCSDILRTDQEEDKFELPNEVSQLPASKSSVSIGKKAMKQHRCY